MTLSAPGPADPLTPVRAELLRAARADADTVLARARADADEAMRAARTEAETLLDRAREQGAADGTAAAARERVRARQDAWTRELCARAEVYADLRARVRTGVRDALADTGVLRVRLEERARALLGTGARVTATVDGGVTAETPGRRVDLSANALADRALDRLGAEAETLWAP
ncbi:hypothetical protein [Streptomyces sp. TP-A0356]|uniref:hypothetical protein n=1 Tax=Streptomyces sp. TP-A0356 TaxID=1359208 RepID=UPI0006E1D83D|nr:hypothetical protein [Streptomyces sp. TP-A0356]